MDSKNSTIAVIGTSSMIGSRYCELLPGKKIIKGDLSSGVAVDITSLDSTENFFRIPFDSVILFSAFTDVDAAEKQRGNKDESCWKINVEGAKNVVNLCKTFERKLILISTDFVFDGSGGPYGEDDKTKGDTEKTSWYGLTKLEAERICMSTLTDYIILRISYPYRAKFDKKLDFARQILTRYENNTLYPMFNDQIITPTFVDDIAPAIEKLLESNEKGIFHLASPESSTPYEFAKQLLSEFGKDPSKLQPASIVDFLTKDNATPRPIKGGLKTEKISKIGLAPTNWKDGISLIHKQVQDQLI